MEMLVVCGWLVSFGIPANRLEAIKFHGWQPMFLVSSFGFQTSNPSQWLEDQPASYWLPGKLWEGISPLPAAFLLKWIVYTTYCKGTIITSYTHYSDYIMII